MFKFNYDNKLVKKILNILFLVIIIFVICIFSILLCEDIINFDNNNIDEEKVLNANIISSYKEAFIIKLPIGNNAFSYGIIVLGNKNKSINTVRHEYGHYLQLKELGIINYTKYIAIPSLRGFWGGVKYSDYYSQPWEYGADLYGGVIRDNYIYEDDAYEKYIEYWDNITS